jgi:hypothetical protein
MFGLRYFAALLKGGAGRYVGIMFVQGFFPAGLASFQLTQGLSRIQIVLARAVAMRTWGSFRPLAFGVSFETAR